MRRSRNRGQPAEFDPKEPPEIPGVTGLTLIGTGGNASVYKGQETALHRPVAVKILHARLRDGKARSVFEGECKRAGQVGEHPYAADVYRPGFAGDWPFLVMRYYARGSLASALGFNRQQPVGETLAVCANVACALQYAHNLSIVHRDVKPENVLLDAYGDPALADFGISTDLDDVTGTLRHAMTPAYAAPEVLQYGGGWTYSDVWSLAATLYALLAGRPPFYDRRYGDPQANMAALAGPLPPLGRSDIPARVVDTLTRALIGRHDTRTVSAQRFAEELNADLQSLGLAPVPIRIEPAGQRGRQPAGLVAPSAPVPPPPSMEPPSRVPPLSLVAPLSPIAPLSSMASPSPTTSSPTAPPRPRTQPSPAPPGPAFYGTNAGEDTSSLTSGGFVLGRDRAPGQRPGAPGASRQPGFSTGRGVPDGDATGYLSTESAYRLPRPEQAPDAKRGRLKLVLAGGGVAVAAFLAAAYLLAAPKHQAASPAASAKASASASAVTSAGAGSASVPPPQDVTVTAVGDTSVRLSWTNTGPHAADPTVIVTMGSGYPTRAVPNASPQVITGLTALQPYCFAIGYYVAQGRVSYSKVTAASCINGGTPSS
jgi:serine/threonine protein kinase